MNKKFDVKADINPDTYMDEYTLIIRGEGEKIKIKIDQEELIDLFDIIKYTIDTNICL